MKNLRRFCAAVALALVFTFSAFAGEMSTPGDVPPPPPPQNQVATTGDIGCPGVSAMGEMSTPGAVAVDPVTEAALGLLQSLLSVF